MSLSNSIFFSREIPYSIQDHVEINDSPSKYNTNNYLLFCIKEKHALTGVFLIIALLILTSNCSSSSSSYFLEWCMCCKENV